jgi:hypothetical protein
MKLMIAFFKEINEAAKDGAMHKSGLGRIWNSPEGQIHSTGCNATTPHNRVYTYKFTNLRRMKRKFKSPIK